MRCYTLCRFSTNRIPCYLTFFSWLPLSILLPGRNATTKNTCRRDSDIVGSIRAGLCFHLKQTIGTARIHRLEKKNWEYAYNRLKSIPNIHILGGVDADKVERLPILSFLIEVFEDGRRHFLHYNFVCSLLNDLYGIQSRGGCQCAGPYAQRLLSLSHGNAQKFENELIDKKEYLNQGLAGSASYFMRTHQVEYICRAIINIAQYGWRLLPLYKFVPRQESLNITAVTAKVAVAVHIQRQQRRLIRPERDKQGRAPVDGGVAVLPRHFQERWSTVRRTGSGSSRLTKRKCSANRHCSGSSCHQKHTKCCGKRDKVGGTPVRGTGR